MTAVLLRPVPFFKVGLPTWVGRTSPVPAGSSIPAGTGHTCLPVDVVPGASPTAHGQGSQGPRDVAS